MCHLSRLSLTFPFFLLEFARNQHGVQAQAQGLDFFLTQPFTAFVLAQCEINDSREREMISHSKQEAVVGFGQSFCVGAGLCYALLLVSQLTPTGGMKISTHRQSLRYLSPDKLYHHIYSFFIQVDVF